MMTSLTTRQRDVLRLLLSENTPIGSAALAAQTQLTARQVSYDLKGVRKWLAERDVKLEVTPGVGIELKCTREQSHRLTRELERGENFQLVLTPGQRQQMVALLLLAADQPHILYQFEQLTQVSRTTVLKDLDSLEPWLADWELTLERRPNYGVWIEGLEQQRRQALSALLWGHMPFDESLTRMEHGHGLVFELADDATLLPLAERAHALLQKWDAPRALSQVAYAEARLKGRYTDDAVLFLALVFAIQQHRVASQQYATILPDVLGWLQTLDVWPIASQLARRLGWGRDTRWTDDEMGLIAMYLLAAPRSDRWPGDLEIDASARVLVDRLVDDIAATYGNPALREDQVLRDGIVTHVFPASLRQRFNLWMPSVFTHEPLADEYAGEYEVACGLSDTIEAHLGVALPEGEISNLALLLRAARIRERPTTAHRVVVVCPSGMASAQLLVARLRTRFPHLEQLEVWSIRELRQAALDTASLVVTTVALPREIAENVDVIQVHPLLLPEDIERITEWLE